ncbi:DsbA family oxidoreductase [Pedobacter sp.]|uniref:DsbA family oxidoreductase n=1 Tax=Pedobacter sp. TaxID=1411316 RepID=UPI003D7F3632
MDKDKMQVEIWSDVMCPFCYIGKRKFEQALAQFPEQEHIEVIWKSYQLAPDLVTDPKTNIHQYLAKHKGMSVEEAKGLNEYVTRMAAEVGLVYKLDQAVVANSFDAHRFSHFAKQFNKQLEAEERLFQAYFTEGKNIDDHDTLLQLGTEIGLDATLLDIALKNGSYTDEVRSDIYEAQQVGVRGVPFFVLDSKYSISGAQDSKTFLQALTQAYNERNN